MCKVLREIIKSDEVFRMIFMTSQMFLHLLKFRVKLRPQKITRFKTNILVV